MAVIKCKMCGGDLKIIDGASTAECEFCGSVQTVPKADDEKKLTLFGRANRLRAACDFDKAAGIYEAIVAEFPEEAEAYWGLVLCKYGIEYVDDPGTGRKIPTCHRSNYESVFTDDNYEQAAENADLMARRLYREEAKAIEELRKRILEVSSREEPYDIFICYKETAVTGGRTLDSVLAQDIYDALTEKGYRVFFSRVTLEDKLGQEYEPYIFAALNSAKIMLAVGTDYEHFNAVWVKNEWSRFLQLMAGGQKKSLIPCYKNMDPYDMPNEFARLQAQDMGKIGAMQDLLRGIEKLMPRQEKVQQVVSVQTTTVDSRVPALLDRGNLALEDGEWQNADKFFDEVLNFDARNAYAYIGKFCAEKHLKRLDQIPELNVSDPAMIDDLPQGLESSEFMKLLNIGKLALIKRVREVTGWGLFDAKNYVDNAEEKLRNGPKMSVKASVENSGNFQKAMRFADPSLKATLQGYLQILEQREREIESESLYIKAKELKEAGDKDRDEEALKQALGILQEISGYRDADALRNECEDNLIQLRREAEQERIRLEEAKKEAQEQEHRKKLARMEKIYISACRMQENAKDPDAFNSLEKVFTELGEYKDSEARAAACRGEILRLEKERLEAQEAEEKRRLEEEARVRAEQARIAKKKKIIGTVVGLLIAAAVIAGVAFYFYWQNVLIPDGEYNRGVELMEAGEYDAAIEVFTALDGYKDSAVMIAKSEIARAEALYAAGDYVTAINQFGDFAGKDPAEGYEGTAERCKELCYEYADRMFSEGQYGPAAVYFENAGEGYSDAAERAKESHYLNGWSYLNEGWYGTAFEMFDKVHEYKDSADLAKYCVAYSNAMQDLFSAEDLINELPEELLNVAGLKADIERFREYDNTYVSHDYSGKYDDGSSDDDIRQEFYSLKITPKYVQLDESSTELTLQVWVTGYNQKGREEHTWVFEDASLFEKSRIDQTVNRHMDGDVPDEWDEFLITPTAIKLVSWKDKSYTTYQEIRTTRFAPEAE